MLLQLPNLGTSWSCCLQMPVLVFLSGRCPPSFLERKKKKKQGRRTRYMQRTIWKRKAAVGSGMRAYGSVCDLLGAAPLLSGPWFAHLLTEQIVLTGSSPGTFFFSLTFQGAKLHFYYTHVITKSNIFLGFPLFSCCQYFHLFIFAQNK